MIELALLMNQIYVVVLFSIMSLIIAFFGQKRPIQQKLFLKANYFLLAAWIISAIFPYALPRIADLSSASNLGLLRFGGSSVWLLLGIFCFLAVKSTLSIPRVEHIPPPQTPKKNVRKVYKKSSTAEPHSSEESDELELDE